MKEREKFKSRLGFEWIFGSPELGFTFPGRLGQMKTILYFFLYI